MAPAPDLDVLYAHLRRRMVETGEWDRIMFVLSSRLNEAGWMDELRNFSKENARNMESLVFQPLFDDTLTHAHRSIPNPTEKEIKSVIRQYLELQFE